MPKDTARRKPHRGRCPDGSPNPVDVHVGQRLRLRRTLLGLTQEKLGEALGVTFQQVQKYERGSNRIGSSRLFDLSRILDVSVGYFYEDMPESIQARSPRRMNGRMDPLPEPEPDPMSRRETLELVRAYYRIGDPTLRRRVLDLVRAAATRRVDAESAD